MTTKQQEREALTKIMTIIAELGEDSYLAKAFESCEEVARENIENDFFDSWKGRYDSMRKELTRWQAVAKGQNKQIAKLKESNERLVAKELERENEPKLTDAEAGLLKSLVVTEMVNTDEVVRSSANTIVAEAENPDGPMFQDAVARNRNATKHWQQLNQLLDKIKYLA